MKESALVKRRVKRLGLVGLALVLALGLVRCATNPATGQRQLMLFSESDEVSLGQEVNEQTVREIGLYPDDPLQAYVERVGLALARESERPELPWRFQVVDDPVVNAFALPGGFISVTRGILTHLGSEAELAGVLGHEIGHVTARHSMNQLSKSQLAQIGLGVGAAISPELQSFSGLAAQGLGLLFLKFGRDDERQADDLGLRYMTRNGYPPAALGEVFTVLARVGEASSGSRLPGWLSTHPDPENRRGLIERQMASVPPEVQQASWEREPYLDQLGGVVYGRDPREGFVRNGRFHHPTLAFQLDVPEGWQVINEKRSVNLVAPQQKAIFVLSLAQGEDSRSAANTFLNQQGVTDAGPWVSRIGDFPTVARTFSATTQSGNLRGGAAFTEYGGQVYQLLGLAGDSDWSAYSDPLSRIAGSFTALRERRYLEVEPMRLELVTLDRPQSLEEFNRRSPSDISLDELALINHTDRSTTLAAGTRVKRVVGFNPDEKNAG